jgi:peptide/nickel transport system permease protein
VVSYVLFFVAPGGPLQALTEINQGGRNRLDPQAFKRAMQRFELDIDHIPRFSRWLIGHPRGPINLFGQELDWQVGCLRKTEEGTKVKLVYPDGREEFSDCLEPIYLKDLEERRVGDGVLRFDFGLSQQILRDRPVTDLIKSRLGPTLLLIGLANLFALLIAVPIGIIAAVKQYSRFDYFITTLTFFGSAMPTLFLGLMGILFFSIFLKDAGLPYLPAQLAASNADAVVPWIGEIKAGSLLDRLWHLVLPVGVLTFVSLTGWSRFIRSSMLEVLKQDYVRTARAKGLRERMVIVKHALRNGLIPFITLVVGIIPALFGGAVVTETIFSWPGLGRLYIDSLGRDYTVSMAILLIGTVLILFSFLLADVLYTVVDPRIRMS